MFYRYDPTARALYVTLVTAPIADSAELAPNVVADYAADGTLVGLEILDVEPLAGSDTRTIAADDTRQTFRELTNKWHDETDGLSSPLAIAMHPSYQQIIGMGRQAIPYILEDLRVRGGQWYWALRAITRMSPVPRNASGHARQVREAWLEWGRKQGY